MKITSAKLKSKIFHKQSDFQKIEVYETENVGKSLFLDDIEQFSEADEIEYHDTMTRVPFSIHKSPNNILIIGGGDGGIARECLKHKSVESIDLCEIDEEVVSTCRVYFPQMSDCLKNEKINILYQDAQNFVKTTENKYDIVLVDSTDPINQALPLFKKTFYKNVDKILKPNGLVVFQMQTVAVNAKIRSQVLEALYDAFKFINFFNCAYHREESVDLTLFCLCSKKEIKIPAKIKNLFSLDQLEYKKIKDFRDKISWLNENA
jgi:spermidine synthase